MPDGKTHWPGWIWEKIKKLHKKATDNIYAKILFISIMFLWYTLAANDTSLSFKK